MKYLKIVLYAFLILAGTAFLIYITSLIVLSIQKHPDIPPSHPIDFSKEVSINISSSDEIEKMRRIRDFIGEYRNNAKLTAVTIFTSASGNIKGAYYQFSVDREDSRLPAGSITAYVNERNIIYNIDGRFIDDDKIIYAEIYDNEVDNIISLLQEEAEHLMQSNVTWKNDTSIQLRLSFWDARAEIVIQKSTDSQNDIMEFDILERMEYKIVRSIFDKSLSLVELDDVS